MAACQGDVYVFDVSTESCGEILFNFDLRQFSPDAHARDVALGERWAVVGDDDQHSAYIFDLESGGLAHHLISDDSMFGEHVDVSGAVVAVGSLSGGVSIFDAEQGELIAKCNNPGAGGPVAIGKGIVGGGFRDFVVCKMPN